MVVECAVCNQPLTNYLQGSKVSISNHKKLLIWWNNSPKNWTTQDTMSVIVHDCNLWSIQYARVSHSYLLKNTFGEYIMLGFVSRILPNTTDIPVLITLVISNVICCSLNLHFIVWNQSMPYYKAIKLR